MIYRHVLFLVFGSLICTLTSAQHFNFNVGYGIGYGDPGDINRVIHVYNSVNAATITKSMPKVNFLHGYTVGITYGGQLKFEISRTARRADVIAEGIVNGENRFRQLRIISNTIGLGVQYNMSKKWTVGLNYDIGNYKGFGRSAAAGEKPKFTRLFVLDNGIFARTQMGVSFFAQYNFWRFSARLYWQLQFINKNLGAIDSWMLNGQQIIDKYHLEGKMNNLGLQLIFRIGRVDYY